MSIRYLWDRLTGRFRRCYDADGYCLTHHTSDPHRGWTR